MRIFSLVGLAFLTSCGGQSSESATAEAAGQDLIACAVGGATNLTKVCTLEHSSKNGALQWIVRHPDGSFRRFNVNPGNVDIDSKITTADGADPVAVELADRGIPCLYATVNGDKYCLPVTYGGN